MKSRYNLRPVISKVLHQSYQRGILQTCSLGKETKVESSCLFGEESHAVVQAGTHSISQIGLKFRATLLPKPQKPWSHVLGHTPGLCVVLVSVC